MFTCVTNDRLLELIRETTADLHAMELDRVPPQSPLYTSTYAELGALQKELRIRRTLGEMKEYE